MVLAFITVYYDLDPQIGVNATCPDWECRNLFFRDWNEFINYMHFEQKEGFELVQITNENYLSLCAQGIFDYA
jgi:hypothetical protein